MEVPDLSELVFIVLSSLIPSFEARYALLLAIPLTSADPVLLFIACVSLNLAVIPFGFLGLDWVSPPFRRRFKWIESIFMWFRRRGKGKKWGFPALVLFVAAPLPGTGAYTGTLMAYLFELKRLPAAIAIAIGVILSATLTTLVALGIIELAGLF